MKPASAQQPKMPSETRLEKRLDRAVDATLSTPSSRRCE